MKKRNLLYGLLSGLLLWWGCADEGRRIAGCWEASCGKPEVEFWRDGTCCFAGMDGRWKSRSLETDTGDRDYIEICFRDTAGTLQFRYWKAGCLYLDSNAFIHGDSIPMIRKQSFRKR